MSEINLGNVMEKKSSLKYFVIYAIIIIFSMNYFISGKKTISLNNPLIVRIFENKLISQKPISFDLEVLRDPIIKDIIIDEKSQDSCNEKKILHIGDEEYVFSSYSGGPIKHTFIHPLTKKELVLFDYSNQINNEDVLPLSLFLDQRLITGFDIEVDDNKVICQKKYHGAIIKKIFIISKNIIECRIEIENNENHNFEIIKIGSQQQMAISKDGSPNGFCYTDDEKISKFFRENKATIDQSVVIYPDLIGFQSDYTAEAIIAKSPFMRGFWNTSVNGAMQYMIEKKVDNNKCFDVNFIWYSGPKEYKLLNAIDGKLGLIMELGWFSKISQLLMSFVLWLASICHSFGLAILLFIILTKLLVVPFAAHMREGNKKSKEFQQKLEYIKAKYHDDKEKENSETMALYKKYGIMPGFSSKIPQFLNLFIVMAFQSVFKKNILLYEVPIGLWIGDATMPDPYYILPIIFLGMMYLTINQGKMPPMFKIAILGLAVLLIYMFSFWSSGVQLFIVGGVVANYIETKFLLN